MDDQDGAGSSMSECSSEGGAALVLRLGRAARPARIAQDVVRDWYFGGMTMSMRMGHVQGHWHWHGYGARARAMGMGIWEELYALVAALFMTGRLIWTRGMTSR